MPFVRQLTYSNDNGIKMCSALNDIERGRLIKLTFNHVVIGDAPMKCTECNELDQKKKTTKNAIIFNIEESSALLILSFGTITRK